MYKLKKNSMETYVKYALLLVIYYWTRTWLRSTCCPVLVATRSPHKYSVHNVSRSVNKPTTSYGHRRTRINILLMIERTKEGRFKRLIFFSKIYTSTFRFFVAYTVKPPRLPLSILRCPSAFLVVVRRCWRVNSFVSLWESLSTVSNP